MKFTRSFILIPNCRIEENIRVDECIWNKEVKLMVHAGCKIQWQNQEKHMPAGLCFMYLILVIWSET